MLDPLFLSNRINDSKDNLFSAILDLEIGQKASSIHQNFNLKLIDIIKNYNLILMQQKQMNKYFGDSMLLLSVFCIFTILYTALFLFDKNANIIMSLFYVNNYGVTFIYLAFLI